jgi:sensor histidine kinase YesM
LQQIRYGNSFSFVNNIDRGIYNYYILPLTLQLLIENALKHNIFNADNPLTIEIKEDKKKGCTGFAKQLSAKKSWRYY